MGSINVGREKLGFWVQISIFVVGLLSVSLAKAEGPFAKMLGDFKVTSCQGIGTPTVDFCHYDLVSLKSDSTKKDSTMIVMASSKLHGKVSFGVTVPEARAANFSLADHSANNVYMSSDAVKSESATLLTMDPDQQYSSEISFFSTGSGFLMVMRSQSATASQSYSYQIYLVPVDVSAAH